MKYNVIVTLEVWDIQADREENAAYEAYRRINEAAYNGDVSISNVSVYEAQQ